MNALQRKWHSLPLWGQWVVAAIGAVVLAVALLYDYETDDDPEVNNGIYGINVQETSPDTGGALEGPQPGELLPAFAAPLVSGKLDGDANVRQGPSTGDGQAGQIPACDVRGPGVLNACALRGRATVMTFLVTGGADCEPQVDRTEHIKSEFRDVNFVVVASGAERRDLRRLAATRKWTQRVGMDSDGAVVNLYGVGVCPTTVFAYPGGKVRSTKLGNLTAAQLRAEIRALLR